MAMGASASLGTDIAELGIVRDPSNASTSLSSGGYSSAE
jgi:hypothetical protein